MTEQPQNETTGSPLTTLVRRHPVMASLVVASILTGAVLGGLYLTPEWSLLRRVAGGALAGGGAAFFALATRIIG